MKTADKMLQFRIYFLEKDSLLAHTQAPLYIQCIVIIALLFLLECLNMHARGVCRIQMGGGGFYIDAHKIFDAMPTFMTTPTDKREELAASVEYSSILYAKAIKKQHIAVPEHKQRRPKILEVSICAFSTEILWIFYGDTHET